MVLIWICLLQEGDKYGNLIDEFQRIENTLLSMADADIQTTDKEPSNPRRGTVRFNVLPWNPLSNNSQGLVVYNGTAWVAV